MLIPISDRAGKAFPVHAHTHGFARWKSGAVSIENETATSVVAKVRGQRTRNVVLQEERGRLLVSCTCPARTFERPGCKHAWAALLEIDRRGALPNLRSTRAPLPVSFLEPPPGSEADANADADVDAASEAASVPSSEPTAAEPLVKSMKAKAKAEANTESTVKKEKKPKKEKDEDEKAEVTTMPVKASSRANDRASRRSVRATSAPPAARGKPRRDPRRSSSRRR
jgi:hypothetical protein